MRFRFDAGQEHQLRAIAAIVGVFDGQHLRQPAIQYAGGENALKFTAPVAPNFLDLGDSQILENIRRIQMRHNESAVSKIEVDDELRKITHAFGDSADNGIVAGQTVAFPNFSVEMETGTGKTYVFLRAARELAREYGFLKFIVITPSVAVREGILHALGATAEHFAAMDFQRLQFRPYNSAKLGDVGDFVRALSPRMMVMTVASFNKAANVIRRDSDKFLGETPLHLIQAARPILILDEPQNMESKLSQESLARLNPLFALRFSATHRNPYNLIYRMSPAEAYRGRLVKTLRIGEVIVDNTDAPLIRLERIARRRGGALVAYIMLNVHENGIVSKVTKPFLPDEDLGERSHLPVYDGISVDDIFSEPAKIVLSNGLQLAPGEGINDSREEIFRAQIRMTVREHFRRQTRLREKGIKVLSLFFIDRVENYQSDDGLIRRLFEECFDELKQGNSEWRNMSAAQVHTGYFAKSPGGDSEKDVGAYDLIMRDKESLLSFASDSDDDEIRRKRQFAFIFSHSALREGWDNPNIFQICTLNEGQSLMRRRQEIGRGLRLAVNQKGERVFDDDVNILTVIPSESHANYVKGYQMEIAEDYRDVIEARLGKRLEDATEEERAQLAEIYGKGIIPPKPKPIEPRTAKRNNSIVLSPEFSALWRRIGQKTCYAVDFKDEDLIGNVVRRLGETQIDSPQVRIRLARVDINKEGIYSATAISGAKRVAALHRRSPLPDIVSLTSRLLENGKPKMMLTRRTLFEIFRRSRSNAALKNPTGWAAAAARIIREQLAELMTEGIEYERIENQFFEWEQHFASEEQEIASAAIAELKKGNKTPYDLIACDSGVEKEFAEKIANREDVKLFLKLPRKFTVPTPVGDYNPDWALLLQDEDGGEKLYFIAETKGAAGDGIIRWGNLRGDEGRKIKCAARHFGSRQFNKKGALSGVDYKVVRNADEIASP